MKTTFVMIALGAMLAAFEITAASSGQDLIPQLQRGVPKDSNRETLTGCVARGTAAGTYLLTNVTSDGDHSKTAPTETPERTSVALSGTDVDVSKHVGHRVSVTGRYASAALVAPTIGTDEKRLAPESVSQADRRPTRTFRIASLTMVSSTCSEQADSGGNALTAAEWPRER